MSDQRLLPTIESKWRIDANISNSDKFSTVFDASAEKDVDLIVVGLGGAGLSAARRAANCGMNVVGFDAGLLGRGAAGSNGGFLLCGASKFYNDAVNDLGKETAEKIWNVTKDELLVQLEEWPDVVKQTGTYRCAGWPYIERYEQPSTYDKDINHVMEHFLALRASNIPVELGDIDGTASIFIKDDGWCQPADRLLKAHNAAVDAGARLYFNCPAKIDFSSSRPSVITAAGKLESRHILFSTDAHLEEFFPELSGEVQTWKLQMISAVCDTDRFSIPMYMRFGYDYITKTDDGVALGGFRDHSLKTEIAAAWDGVAPLNDSITEKLTVLASMITGKSLDAKMSWSSAVGYTTSGLPIVREIRPGVWACGAYNGHGNLLSFVCGKAIVDRILNGQSVALDLLASRG